jgi:type IV pilus assembly protein PilC
MPKYFYQAKSLTGQEKSGEVEARDQAQLARILKEQGFILIKAEQEQDKTKKIKSNVSFSFLNKVPLTEKLIFTRNLQVMISAGLALPRALETLALQTKNRKLQTSVLNIKEEIIKGNSFSQSLREHSDVFSELFQSMIKVGEEAGNLEEVLKILAQQMERENELKSKIKGALMYPAVVILAMIGIGILMLTMVVPKLAETFVELEIDLPFTTQVVIGIGTFLAEKWFLAILIVLVFLFLFRLFLMNKQGKRIIEAVLFKVPIISPLIKKINTASTVRTLSSLISAGVPIVRSLNIVAGVLGNSYYRTALLEASEKIKKGGKLSEAIAGYQDIYPLVVIQMLKVGEETGETATILKQLADFFEEEISYATKNLTAVIEPVLMIIVGSAIGFFAISMVQPMYSMLGAI